MLRRGIDTQIRKQITANCSTATPTSGDMPRTIHIEAMPSAVDDKNVKRNSNATSSPPGRNRLQETQRVGIDLRTSGHRCRGRIVFRHYRDVVPVPKIDPPRVRTVLVLQSNEELQSAIERARAFERRDEYERRVGAYDRYLNMLAQVMRMPPEHTEEERTTGSRDRVLPCADLADTPPSSE